MIGSELGRCDFTTGSAPNQNAGIPALRAFVAVCGARRRRVSWRRLNRTEVTEKLDGWLAKAQRRKESRKIAIQTASPLFPRLTDFIAGGQITALKVTLRVTDGRSAGC
eukprot:scaffold301_cov243-Pinguiococcus_pyrenoidosus.AAC.40